MLAFDEGPHVYRWDGAPVPSVTQIIKPLYSFDFVDPAVLERARQEGVAIHKMVELDCVGELDEDGLPAWLRSYFAAWRAFVAETGFELEASEQRVYSPTYRYAGTLDLRGRTRRHARALIDVKRSFAAGRAIGVQLAGYAQAVEWPTDGRNACARYGLQLRADGTYRMQAFADPKDWSVFLACLTLKNWMENPK
jgi:hypothetical protein